MILVLQCNGAYLRPIWDLSGPICTYFGYARARFLKTHIFPLYLKDSESYLGLIWVLPGSYLGPIFMIRCPVPNNLI